MLLRIAAPLLTVADAGAGENLSVSGDAPPPLIGDAPPNEGPPAAPDKGSAGDAAPGQVEAYLDFENAPAGWSSRFAFLDPLRDFRRVP